MWFHVLILIYTFGLVGVYSDVEMELSDLDKPIPIVNVYGVVGHQVKLPCNIQSRKGDKVDMVMWFKGEGTAPIYRFDVRGSRQFSSARLWSAKEVLGGRAYFMATSTPAHLSIDRLEYTDQGIYRCRVDFNDSPTEHQNVNLIVIVMPEKPVIHKESLRNATQIKETYNEGSDVHLTCESRGGVPPPRLIWYLDNTVIDESFHYNSNTAMTVNHLSYPKIGRQHLGARLVCQANNTNLVPPQTNLVVLDINLKPLMVKILTKELKVSSDKKYAVECSSMGSRPAAVITWWKDNKQITQVVQNYPPEDNHSISILEFIPGIEDDGKYLTCRAENPSISDSVLEDKWRLDVQYQPIVSLQIGSNLNPEDIKEGVDVYFECTVQANPKAYKLAWYKDDKELKNNATSGIVLSDHSLVLQRLTRASAGEYKCLAANSEGKTASNTVKLQVMYTPVCKEGKNEVVVGALKQETISLICATESHPEPLTYQWTFNNSGELVEVQQQSRFTHLSGIPNGPNSIAESLKEYQQFHGSRLNYTPATEMDYGTVACRATNQVGKQLTPCLFQVIAAGRPYPLHNCTVTEMSNIIDSENNVGKFGAGLTVHCLEGYDGGLPIQSYHLTPFEEPGDDRKPNITVTAGLGNGPTFEVTSLKAGRNYRLYLYAVNSKGWSDPTILEPVTLKGVAMYTGNTNVSALSPLLLGLATTATLLSLAVAGILAALYRKHSDGRTGSPKHAPIVCEPPNAGTTTPVHSQTKQAVDDIDPDIIPNEYERRPLTYTTIYKTQPQIKRKECDMDDDDCDDGDTASMEKKPIVESTLNIHMENEGRTIDSILLPTLNYQHNHHITQPPTMADFKQMAMDAYNQRNHQNVYYSLQRSGKGLASISQRPVSSSISAHGKFHQPEVVTRSNRIQESCI
ncbi:nephrin-like [Aphidius gifuensis]|uniref:nephrin-like n=1 Tax=Aphidius gifuensis TaxID=684658 RepID=UPI001CDD1FF0|nr:nephrin-like [Aphidius gifuensis]